MKVCFHYDTSVSRVSSLESRVMPKQGGEEEEELEKACCLARTPMV